MTDDRKRTVLVSPEDLDLVRSFLAGLHREPDAAPRSSAEDLRVREMHEFAREIVDLALRRYAREGRDSVPHDLVVHIHKLARKDEDEVARILIAEIIGRTEVRARFCQFLGFDDGDTSKLETALVKVLETGKMSVLGSDQANAISSAKSYHRRANRDFILESRKFIDAKYGRTDPEKKKKYLRWLASIAVPFDFSPSTRPTNPVTRAIVKFSLLATAFGAGISVLATRECQPSLSGRTTKSVASEGNAGLVVTTSATTSSSADPKTASTDIILDRCLKMSDKFEAKRCLIASADAARADFATAKRRYQAAIAFTYDPRGMSDRKIGSDTIPELSLSNWQTYDAYDGLSSLHSLHGHDSDALRLYQKRFDLKRSLDGHAFDSIKHSAECLILLALTVKATSGSAALSEYGECSQGAYPMNFGIVFENSFLGAAHEAAGEFPEALDAYAKAFSVAARADPMDDGGIGGERWRHLSLAGDPVTDMNARALKVAEQLRRSNHALVEGDFIVWVASTGSDGAQRLGFLRVDLVPGSGCAIVSDEMDFARAKKKGRLTIIAPLLRREEATLATRDDSPYGPWYGTIGKQDKPVRIDISLESEITIPATMPPGCLSSSRRIQICLFPDGWITPAGAC